MIKGWIFKFDNDHACGIIYPYTVFWIGPCASKSLIAVSPLSILPSVIMLKRRSMEDEEPLKRTVLSCATDCCHRATMPSMLVSRVLVVAMDAALMVQLVRDIYEVKGIEKEKGVYAAVLSFVMAVPAMTSAPMVSFTCERYCAAFGLLAAAK